MPKTIDIETIPDRKMTKYLPEPDVKYGNLKDEAKREEKRQDAVMKQLQDMTLNPLTASVVAAVVVGEGVVVSEILVEKKGFSEWECLDLILEHLRLTGKNNPTIITWNGTAFDIPFLYKRALIHDRILKTEKKELMRNLPPLAYWSKRYTVTPHCDLPLVWGGWTADAKYTSLESVALPLLHEEKLKVSYDMLDYHDLYTKPEGRRTRERGSGEARRW